MHEPATFGERGRDGHSRSTQFRSMRRSKRKPGDFGIDDRDGWLGRLGDLQAANARLVARCLDAALAASALASGQPRPTTAIRMLMGRSSLRTSEAASMIKRLLSISRPAIADLLADDALHLGRTLRWAENLRGRTARSMEREPRPDRGTGGTDSA